MEWKVIVVVPRFWGLQPFFCRSLCIQCLSESGLCVYQSRGAMNCVEDIFYELTNNENSVTQQVEKRQNLRHIDEFLLVLMRLRLGLLIEDLSERFKICRFTCSEVFTKWIFFFFTLT